MEKNGIKVLGIFLVVIVIFSACCLNSENKVESKLYKEITISLGTKDNVNFSIEALNSSDIDYDYVVPEEYEEEEGKEPIGETILALVYDYDDNTQVYLGYHQPWFQMKSDKELDPDTVSKELQRLIGLGVFTGTGLAREDIVAIEEVLQNLEPWEFGIEIGYREGKWQQNFPKSKIGVGENIKRIGIQKEQEQPIEEDEEAQRRAEEQEEVEDQSQDETSGVGEELKDCTISLATKDNVNFSIEALNSSDIDYDYVVPEEYEEEEGKEPIGETILALVYDYDDNTQVYLGYHQPWFQMKSDKELDPDTVLNELERLIDLGVFTGLTKEDISSIEEVLHNLEPWEFGIEIGYREGKWQQNFPKSKIGVGENIKRIGGK